jgi:hypothetical protein
MSITKKIKSNITIIASNRGITQQQLIEEYLLDGISKDENYLKSHLETN